MEHCYKTGCNVNVQLRTAVEEQTLTGASLVATKRDLYKCIPNDKIRAWALDEHEQQMPVVLPPENSCCLANALNFGFDWAKSKQGVEYWALVHQCILGMELINPLTFAPHNNILTR